MRLNSDTHATTLEVGFALFGLGCLAGLVALLAGRLAGDTARHQRHHQPAPPPGTIPGERHQQLATSPR